MNIRPSAAIRQNYNEIAAPAAAPRPPFTRPKRRRRPGSHGHRQLCPSGENATLREQLLSVEEDRAAGEPAARWKNWTTIWTAFWAGEGMKYTVIVSDRARQMLGQHLRFLAQVDRQAAERLKSGSWRNSAAWNECPALSFFRCRIHPAQSLPQAVRGKQLPGPVSGPGRYRVCGLDRRLPAGLFLADEIAFQD